jgi:two-component system OmpR family sensor kinase
VVQAVGVRVLVRPSLWGVRTRSALAAALVVTVAFALASGALLLVLQRSLQSAGDTSSAARAAEISTQLATTAPGDLAPGLLATDGRTAAVQVLDADGVVVLASPGALARPMIATRPSVGQVLVGDEDSDPLVPDDFRVTAEAVDGAQGRLTVLVAAGQQPVESTLVTVAALLAVGLPVIVLVVGVATYALVGRSLRPVERMRVQVAAVSSADLAERVPVPAPQDEIARLARTMNAMLSRLQAGQEAQRRFVGDASHELRSPLTTITAALELARDHPETLDAEVVGGVLLPEAERMHRLVADLLLLASADERGLPLQVVDVDLDDLVDAEIARTRAGGLDVVAAVHPVRVRGDAARLARVVRNLTDNAVRHAHGRIWASCCTDGGWAVLTVGDDGPGIPAVERDRVLERFVRLDAGRARSEGGSGLGLAIVVEIVTAHGGTVVVGESAAGGAEVGVRLPLG